MTFQVLAAVLGVFMVGAAFADLLNTLVSTSTSNHRWWLSQIIGYRSFAVVRAVARRLPEDSLLRELVLALFGPLLVFLLLLAWITQQIIGFALIWWAVGGIEGADSFVQSVYYSGVVFFTVGFGEIVPTNGVTRVGAAVEAACGVITVALVVGYLPSLYAAYSDRERKLQTLDDGSGMRITPTNLVMAWSPDADPAKLAPRFAEWEDWASGILETHSTLPLIQLFRSHHRKQNWVTGLGVLIDVSLHSQIIKGSAGPNESWWFYRRVVTLFDELTSGVDLEPYDHHLVDPAQQPGENAQFVELYETLSAHGFELIPMDEARERMAILRNRFAPQMEYLIDYLLAPRGFWSADIGLDLPALKGDRATP